MIRVKYVETDNVITKIEISGHANSTTIENHDLVCAAVSAVSVGALNALKNVKGFNIKMSEGYILAEAIESINAHDQVVLETLMVQLRTIEADNQKFIKITK